MSGHGHHKVEHGATVQDIVVMAMTFIVGLAAGFYLYVSAFAPQFDEYIGHTEEVYEGFVLEGSQYGGDRMGGTAPSFQLLENGTFRYLPYSSTDDRVEAKEGVLPRELLTEVKQTLTDEALVNAAQTVTRGECLSYVDGRDFAYTVTLAEVDYTLDTCTTNLQTDSILGATLDKIWNYFTTLE